MRALFVWACAGSFVFFSGCGGDSSGRQPVAGMITLKGQPLAEGTISFASKAMTPEIFSGALIKEGRFTVPAQAGLLPGSYVVRISAPQCRTVAAEGAPGVAGPPAMELVPPEFNAASKLEFQVQSGTKNQLELNIP